MFNPAPRIEAIPITPQQACYVIDDALLEPQRWIEHAAAHAHAFQASPHNAYPGIELAMPDTVSVQLDAFVSRHLRTAFGVRRTVRAASRLALATRAPHDLHPRQWLPHVDRLEAEPDQRILASVLYLFDDASLGGTGFYRPIRPQAEVLRLLGDALAQPPAVFAREYGIAPGYMGASNAWFERVLTVPARFNRLIVYDGRVFHSGDIPHPERLSEDPRRGRLTCNGFFVCRRALGV